MEVVAKKGSRRIDRVIYKLQNTVTGVVYIGMDSHWPMRRHIHLHNLRFKKHPNPHLQASFDLHGESAFEFEVLGRYEDNASLKLAEIDWITKFDSYRNGFNRTPGGEGRTGPRPAAELEKLIARNKGERSEHQKLSAREQMLALRASGKSGSRKGCTISPEHRAKINAAKDARGTERRITEEIVLAIRADKASQRFPTVRGLCLHYANETGASPATIEKIVQGKSWKKVLPRG